MAIQKAFQTIPQKTIIAPLNWGLGHATRCIPIIDYLLNQGSEVVIASDGNAKAFLEKEYPSLKSYELPAYNITYKQKKIEHSVLLQTPKIAKAILAEKEFAKRIRDEEKPDLIISDNRLGFRANEVPSIYMTHQLKLLSDSHVFSRLGSKIHSSYIEKFDTCWIPDLEGSILSGKMSESSLGIPKLYVGCLSRFKSIKPKEQFNYDNLAILSGPEPQRTKLEEILVGMLSKQNQKSLLIRGLVKEDKKTERIGNLEIINYALSTELEEIIAQSKTIICRSGYSSIMDLYAMNRKAILIPTPGQTEQEYLAKRASQQGTHICLSQKELNENLLAHLG